MCKTLNDLVEPHVFSKIAIESEKGKTTPEFLSCLASGKSPYVRWAKELQLRWLIRLRYDDSSWSNIGDPWRGKKCRMMLACQSERLIPAIESLVQVESVECVTFLLSL